VHKKIIKNQPFLKWAGGKTQLLPELEKYIPKSYGKYIEPFLGGGALFFKLTKKPAILSDLNEELVNCYTVVRDNVDSLVKVLQQYPNDEDFYYEIRKKNLNKLDEIERAARIIYLNKTCYNGLYRVNKSGQFNVPFGKRVNPTICAKKKLEESSDALKGVRLICDDYKNVVRALAKPNDFVYFDPPYYPVGGFSDFKRYTKEFFYEEDHVELRDLVLELVNKNVKVLLNNSNTEFVRKLYEGFDYRAVNTRRNISSNASTRTGQDLIVIATQKKKKTSTHLGLKGKEILENFPGTRFMGSKYRVLPFLWDCVKDLPFETVLDAFSGSGCVSYMFKQRGKKVISNDFMNFCYQFSNALIENDNVVLTKQDVARLLKKNSSKKGFVSKTFKGLYFSGEENAFLDTVRANINGVKNKYKKSLALAALSRACLKRRARGIFTYVGDRYDDGRRDMQIPLKQHFLENVEAFNKAVFNNGCKNEAINDDIFNLKTKPDLAYFDPPYYSPKSDNDYTRRYHFVEGLVREWKGLEIQENTKTKKFKRYETPFLHKDSTEDAFNRLFEKYKDSILVVSYSSNGLPNKSSLLEMLKKYKKEVIVHQVEHLYSFGTHAHKVGTNANKVLEYVFIAY
jgi:DNA adenine methylase